MMERTKEIIYTIWQLVINYFDYEWVHVHIIKCNPPDKEVHV